MQHRCLNSRRWKTTGTDQADIRQGRPRLAAGQPSRIASAVLTLLLLGTGSATAATLHYEAYLSGVKVGEATVQFEHDADGYRIEGVASAQGVAMLFSDWHSEFYARGRIREGRPELTHYGYEEHERKKHRILRIEDGRMHQIKNGKPRPDRPVLDGTDVLTAFYMDAGCWTERLLHTGRYNYSVEGRTGKRGCEFLVVDEDDGDRDRVRVEFAERHGLLLPVRMTTRGLIRGSVVLRDSPPDTAAGNSVD